MNYIPENYLEDIQNRISDFLRLNCITFLDDESIFSTLHLDNINFIITHEDLLISSEKYLLDKILKHSHVNNGKEEDYNEVMKNINWNEIDIREIDEKDLDIIDMNLIKKSKSQKSIKRRYVNIPSTDNKLLNKIILNGLNDSNSIDEMNCILLFYYYYNS